MFEALLLCVNKTQGGLLKVRLNYYSLFYIISKHFRKFKPTQFSVQILTHLVVVWVGVC